MRQGLPLLAIPDCGMLSAAAIIGETAAFTDFLNMGAFARPDRYAPVPVWSGASKVRLTPAATQRWPDAVHDRRDQSGDIRAG
jgi:transposase